MSDDFQLPPNEIEHPEDGLPLNPMLEHRKNALLARFYAQSERLKKLLASADPALIERLNRPI